MITRLRDRMGPDSGAVVHESGAYRLAVAGDQIDAFRFEQAVDRAEVELVADPQRTADRLVISLDQWRGGAFQPFGTQGRLAVASGALEERRRQTEELLVQALLDAGQSDSAAVWATTFVETEPYRERRWEQLMLALYRTGRQAEAIRTARRAAATLRDDLGIEPGPGLRRLEADILDQSPSLELSRPDGSDPGDPGAGRPGGADPGIEGDVDVAHLVGSLRHRGPPVVSPATSFVGRVEDEARLSAAVDRSRLTTIVGPPGVGKTRLAGRVAAAQVGVRVAWLDLVPLTAETVATHLAEQLGARAAGREIGQALASALGSNPLLLVLDNCEHLIAPVADLAEALLASTPVKILATSRVPLASPSEELYDLRPLGIEDGLRLLVDRAGGTVVTLGGQRPLVELVERLDGIPLAIELVAPALATTSARHLRDELGGSLRVATGRGRLDPRHRSLQETLSWSRDLLDDDDRQLSDLLGVFPGSFTTGDAADLVVRPVAEVEQALTRLAVGGLLRSTTADDGRQTWCQLHIVRTGARDRLREAGQLDRWQRANAERHIELVERLAPELVGPGEDLAVIRLGRSLDQLRATHAWLVERGSAEAAASYALAMWNFSFFRLHYSHYHWLDDALALDGAEGSPHYLEALAQAALAAWASDRFLAAVTRADQAEELARAGGLPTPLPALKARFNVAVHEHRYDDATILLMRLFDEANRGRDPYERADVLVSVALGLAQIGVTTEAVVAADQGLDLAQSTGNPTSVAWSRVGVGSAHLVDDPLRAARSFSAASRLARTVRNHWVDGMAMTGLVSALRRQGRPDQAAQLLLPVVELWGRAHVVSQLWRSCQEAILLLVERGADREAAHLLARLDLADHVHPMLPDDQARLDGHAADLRMIDLTAPLDAGRGPPDDRVPASPGVGDPSGLAAAVVAALCR